MAVPTSIRPFDATPPHVHRVAADHVTTARLVERCRSDQTTVVAQAVARIDLKGARSRLTRIRAVGMFHCKRAGSGHIAQLMTVLPSDDWKVREMTRRRALVTGANGGIGSVICKRLRADGVAVQTMDVVEPADVVLDLTADPMPEFDADDIDICIAVAGVVDTFAPAHLMSAEQWSRDIGVNLTGAFRVIQACLLRMRGRRFGRIVAISSMAGRMGAAGKVAYAASKAGLHGMIRTIAIENCAHGITANLVLPGITDTPKLRA